ncbi:MAG: hypothetical protein J0L57_16150 [Burkholderiales bacterium]|nr:hypothetical protein [Burkholderiales bacterium]
MNADDARVALELRSMRVELAELREDLATLLRRQLKREDRRIALALWPWAGEIVCGEKFIATSLSELALGDRSAYGEAARELIAEANGDGTDLRPFGEFLARMEGVPLAGWRLVDAGDVHGVRRWRLRRVGEAL